MSYDAESFKAGLALGRLLWRPRAYSRLLGFVELVQRPSEQARPTLYDTYYGTFSSSSYDLYGYTVAPWRVWVSYYTTASPYPGQLFIAKTAAGFYEGYPDGSPYAQRYWSVNTLDAHTGLYYIAAVASNGPTRIPSGAEVFASVEAALHAFKARGG